jgi:hypothetical protein
MSVFKRHTLLKRHSALSRAGFSQHYRNVHGPLAAAQPGFRRFAYRYIQNHVEESFPEDGEPPFDGITTTFQAPRSDYRQGFFQHPDYANVRPDEERLFDLAGTVSVLGEEKILLGQPSAEGAKAIILSTADGGSGSGSELTDNATSHGIQTVVRNDLDTGSASDLGAAGAVSFPCVRLWEIWFATPEARRLACANPAFIEAVAGDVGAAQITLAVQEIVVFADPRPDYAEVLAP